MKPEAALQRAVAVYLADVLPPDAYWTAVDAGQGKMDMVAAAIRKSRGVKAGFPDVLVIFRGMAFGVELKAPQGRTQDVQHATHAAMRQAGAQVSVCRSVADVERALMHWMIPLRWHAKTPALRDEAIASRVSKPARKAPAKPRAAKPTRAQITRGNRIALAMVRGGT
jgi:hypothetical protein